MKIKRTGNRNKNKQAPAKQPNPATKEESKIAQQSSESKTTQANDNQLEQKTQINAVAVREEEKNSEPKITKQQNNQEAQSTQADAAITNEEENNYIKQNAKTEIVEANNKQEQFVDVAGEKIKNDQQNELKVSGELKQKNTEKENCNATGLSKINALKKELEIVENILNQIEKGESFLQAITKIIKADDENTVVIIAKNTKYFLHSKADKKIEKEKIIYTLISECCLQGKMNILEKLQIELGLELKDLFKKLYQCSEENILVEAAKKQDLNVIKFLLEKDFLFISKQKDENPKLISVEKITEKNIDFQIPFLQYIFESEKYNQDIKLQFTKTILDFIDEKCLNKEKILIVNYITHIALKNLAHKALAYSIKYAKDNKMGIETSKQGIFSESNVEPHSKWEYKKSSNSEDLAKTIKKLQELNFPEVLRSKYEKLSISEDELNPIVKDLFNKYMIVVESQNKSIEALIECIDINNEHAEATVAVTGEMGIESH